MVIISPFEVDIKPPDRWNIAQSPNLYFREAQRASAIYNMSHNPEQTTRETKLLRDCDIVGFETLAKNRNGEGLCVIRVIWCCSCKCEELKMKKIENDCGPKCRSKCHITELNNVITKGSLRQCQLFLLRCCNFQSNSDNYGRTVLHMAASCGKWQLVKWLLNKIGMETKGKDIESGWTALHRALFYGQLTCGRELIMYGSSLQVRDKDGLTPLDIVMKDRLLHVEFVQSGLQEVYTWGDNSNFTLGHENEQHRKYPEMIENFRKKSISVKQVVMSKYHGVFLSTSGLIYTCGHGRGGRLGHGNEQTCLEPKLIEAVKDETCCCISASRDHTVLLMESRKLFSCGLNDYHQLGQIPLTASSLLPKQMNIKVLKGKHIKGVCTQRFHTVIYTKEALFTFGLNAGQLGHIKVPGEKIITQARQVSALNHKDIDITLVSCSDAATVIYTSKGDVYVLHEYQCRKIVSKRLGLIQVTVIGGHLDHNIEKVVLKERGGSELLIAMLNSSGKVFLWRGTDPLAKRCSWSTKRSLHITQISLSLNSIAFITKDGDAFTATIPKPKAKDKVEKVIDQSQVLGFEKYPLTVSDLLVRDEVTEFSTEKIYYIHRATAISADRKGRNFAVLQCQPNACLTEIPLVTNSEMKSNFKGLLDEADPCDMIHDCIIKVNNQDIAVHKYILSTRSEFFKNRLNEKTDLSSLDKKSVINIDDVHSDIFIQMLNFIYTDTCDIITKGRKVDFNFNIRNVDRPLCSSKSDLNPESISTYIDIEKIGKQSAYAVQETVKKKAKINKKKDEIQSAKSGRQVTDANYQSNNPVRLLQDMAKIYGVKYLVKRLDAVKYSDGVIQSVVGRHLPPPRIRFDRNKFQHLYDISLKCADGVVLQAHRCVLVARLEYFKSMLASGWVETSTDEPLSIPVPGDIMSVILDYLYTDDSTVVDTCENAEFLCNILVVADQFLITRLREMCEVSIASQISLKNVAEVLQLASFYNAKQLKVTCQQFICINLTALLESHSLDILDDDVLEELTEYYKEMCPGLKYRQITPYEGGPSKNYLEELENMYEGFDVNVIKAEVEETVTPKKTKSKKKRNRTKSCGEEHGTPRQGVRKVSVCSVTSEDSVELEDSSNPTSPVQSPRNINSDSATEKCHAQKHTVRESITHICNQQTTQFVNSNNISANKENLSLKEVNNRLNCGVSVENKQALRDIIAEEEAHLMKETNQKIGAKSFSPGKKLSQKERKRLSKEGIHGQQDVAPISEHDQITSEAKHLPNTNGASGQGAKPKSRTSNTKAWATNNGDGAANLVQSFKELMIDEEKNASTPLTLVAKISVPHTPLGPGGDTLVSWGLASRPQHKKSQEKGPISSSPQQSVHPKSPKENPWQNVYDIPKPTKKTVSFSDILIDETKQSEKLQKASNKPLQIIQIEEQAIQELLEYYASTTSKQKDVKVTVERVSAKQARPTWAATQISRKS